MSERDARRLLHKARLMRIVVVLTEDEHRLIVLAALKARMKTGDFARWLLLGALTNSDGGDHEHEQHTDVA